MINTPGELIRKLGGVTETALFFGVTKQAVSNWKTRSKRLPPQKYFIHQDKLKKAGIVAHSGVWFPERRKGSSVKKGME